MSVPINLATPFISVTMCAYNVKPYIEEAVNSIFNQSYTNYELLISDDGSTDGTREWLAQLKTHPKVRLFFQDKNLGYVANKNFLIRQTKGNYITQNDSDDLSAKDRLEQQVSIISNMPEIKIVACGYNKIDNSGKIYKTIQLKDDKIIQAYAGEEYPFWFPPLLVHKEVYQKVGMFTSYFEGMGDDLYWTVKANANYPIYCLKAPLYNYRDNPASITNVLNNSRKLIVPALLQELIQQQQKTGTDWLEENNLQALSSFEKQLLNDKKYMAEQYRIWAAKAVDKKDKDQAIKLLTKAFKLYPWTKSNFATLSYYIRTSFN